MFLKKQIKYEQSAMVLSHNITTFDIYHNLLVWFKLLLYQFLNKILFSHILLTTKLNNRKTRIMCCEYWVVNNLTF